MKSAHKIAIFSLLALGVVQICFAQQGTETDMVPLSTGNVWFYSFSESRNSSIGHYRESAEGGAKYQVISSTVSGDSISWHIDGKRSFTRRTYSYGILTSTTGGEDSTSFVIVERTSGLHELLVLMAGIGYTQGSDAFPFWQISGDSTRFYRFALADSNSHASFDVCRCNYYPNIHRQVEMKGDTGVTSSSGSVLHPTFDSDSWSYSLLSFVRGFPGPHLNAPRAVSFNGLAGVPSDTTILLLNNGTEPLSLVGASSSDPALSGTFSMSTVGPDSWVSFTMQHLSPPSGSSFRQMIILSSSPTSPDTIDVVINAGMDVVLETVAECQFGDVFYSRRHIDTVLTIRNSGNLPLQIDSVAVIAPEPHPPTTDWHLDRTSIGPGESATLSVSLLLNPNITDQVADLLLFSNAPSSPDRILFRAKIKGGVIIYSSHLMTFRTDVHTTAVNVLSMYRFQIEVSRTHPSNPVFSILHWPQLSGGGVDSIEFAPRRGGIYSDSIIYTSWTYWPGDVPAKDTVHLYGIADGGDLAATSFALYQNYPNPFNNSTTIEFDIPEPTFTTLRILDVLGREVALLLKEQLQPGQYRVPFIAASLASGVYFLRLEKQDLTLAKKMLLLR